MCGAKPSLFMKLSNVLGMLSLSCAVLGSSICRAAESPETADLIIENAKVVTVDSKFTVEQAIAIQRDRILAVGKTKDMAQYTGPNTRVIDAKGKVVMPGL